MYNPTAKLIFSSANQKDNWFWIDSLKRQSILDLLIENTLALSSINWKENQLVDCPIDYIFDFDRLI